MKGLCPECEAEIPLPVGTVVGEIFVCPDCGVELELGSLDPPKFELAPETEEDHGE